jgi:hypothetical protein
VPFSNAIQSAFNIGMQEASGPGVDRCNAVRNSSSPVVESAFNCEAASQFLAAPHSALLQLPA